jgi:hypothetical protein
MSPKFGSYLFRNLKGQMPDRNPGGDSLGSFGVFEEQPILLRQEDIRADDPRAPQLDWSGIENHQIAVQLKETQGLMDGCVTIKASTLQRICPALLPHPFEDDYLFPVSLKTVVLQLQAQLQRKFADIPKAVGANFDTPIAQVAREDEGFFKLEKVAQQPPVAAVKPQAKPASAEPFLTPADRPTFPPIREKPRASKVESEPPALEITLQQPVPQNTGVAPKGPSKAGPFDELPKVGPEAVPNKKSEVTTDQMANQEKDQLDAEIPIAAQPLDRTDPAEQKLPRKSGLERLQEIFMTEDLLDARQVAALIARFPKVRGALILLSDGTLMGGELPKEFRADATLLAPAVMRTILEFGRRLKLQDPSAVTVYLDQPVSLCAARDVHILIAHEGRGLLPGMRERICEIAKALDVLYAQGGNPDP